MNTSHPPRVLVIATSRQTEGGITSVVKAHELCSCWQRHRTRWVETHRNGSVWVKLWYLFKSLAQCLICMPAYDLVHIHLSEVPSALRKTLFFVLAKGYGKKIILHFHSFSPATTIGGRFRGLYRWLFAHAEAVVVLSPSWKRQVEQYLGLSEHIEVIYNPCFEVSPGKPDERRPSILYAGALNRRKGYEDLIRAFATVAPQFSDWKLVLAGSGEVDKARALAETLHIAEQVVLPGWVSGAEKDRCFRQASIFCLPSYAEGFPTAILDACSYGLPFVTTPVGGIPDMIEHGRDGLLFEPGDLTTLAAHLTTLMSDTALRNRLGERAHQLAQTVFSLSETNRLLTALYRQVGQR